ncbi:CRISPR-associated protein, Cas2 family [Methanocella conradii HZ254]|uniref:CRISPR-associated endoribonuclease Cas2 n=1 Tax=Methanocella conradii (strain DSM 24694 / JCM 17849 / CGMCC 1.5162 / HZ254) TaxID=1041930 RepID=H8I8N2_METCZ|nr:CRISPR-associated endonuclease Cas2 [Methanocella conradii]AFC99936.1 CRISPR-associated protein, Cas2 family [Methanocella conradii HZ254]MDI6897284.1 CRISPR-associated endonuclease Cas2 [Methanocella conradii]
MMCLVIYDITDDKRRNKLAAMLKVFGLARIQYSAFRGELNSNDRMVLAKKASQFVEDEKDSIFIIPLCDRCLGTATVLSKGGACLVKESKVQIV